MNNKSVFIAQQKNLYALTLVLLPLLKHITRPLKHLGIMDFSYYTILKNNKAFYICTREKLHRMHYHNGIGFEGLGSSAGITKDFGIQKLLFFGNPDQKIYASIKPINGQVMFQCNLWNSAAFYTCTHGVFESFNFFGRNDTENLIELYMNHEQILRLFIVYFKEKFTPILKAIDKDQFVEIIKDTTFNHDVGADLPITLLKKSIPDSSRRILTSKGELISISPRQGKVLEYLANGTPIRSIRAHLSISESTVRQHINRIKLKTNLWKTHEIINSFYKAHQSAE